MSGQQQALRLFEKAIELPADRRAKFVAAACSGDTELLQKVESLLAIHDEHATHLPTIRTGEDTTGASAACGDGSALLRNGTRLLDRFEIRSLVGAGGMGEVYRAADLRLERDVAVKVLNPTIVASQAMAKRFEREMKSVASLSHPNLVTLHDYASDDDLTFAVMEFVDGPTLRDEIATSIDWQSAVDLGLGIASGLSAAHARNMMHRDIKPENVIVTAHRHPKILDFGIARPESPTADQDLTTEHSTLMGTAPYMSPEQTEGAELTCATDVFSLGTVLYEMLTGTNPFRGKNAFQTMKNVSQADPPQVSQQNSDLPEELVWLVTSMMHAEPSQRPSAEEAESVLSLLQLSKLLVGKDV